MRKARFAENQAATLEDFNNLANLPFENLDALIASAIDSGASYSGGAVFKSGVTAVTIENPLYLFRSGRLYTGGSSPTVIDLLSVLPTSGNRRIVAILGQVLETNDATRPRDFEVDGTVYPPVMQPQPTETQVWRQARITFQTGDSAPSPVRPVVDAANTVLAWVTLSSTEVVTVEQNLDARISTSRNMDGRVKVLENFRETVEPQVGGLLSDVAKLSEGAKGKMDRNFQGYMLEQLARLNERVGIPQDVSYSRANHFLDEDDSDLQNIAFLAKVEEGIRFADANRTRLALSVQTPGDTRFVIGSNGMLLPKYRSVPVLSVLGRDSETAVSNAGSQTISYVLKTVSRTRIRWGNSMTVCTNSAWWQTGRYNSVTGVFERAGETFSVDIDPLAPDRHVVDAAHRLLRLTQFWEDKYEDPYWDKITVPASYTGNVSANTFLVPRSGWLTSIPLGFSRLDTGGDVRMILCEVNSDGSPNYKEALADVTVTRENLRLYPQMTEFPFQPVYLEGGSRYAWAIITSGNHWLAMVEGNKYSQGTFFTSTDGVWSQGNLALDGCFQLKFAEFENSRLVINLNNFNLDGGITDIDLELEQVAPEGSTITFEVQVGSAWYPLARSGGLNHPLYGLPAALNVRMVVLGTTEVMPGIKLGTSFYTVSRPRTNFVHISLPHLAPSNVDEIRVVSQLEYYNEAEHDSGVELLMGGTFATVRAPSSVSDQVLPDGSIRRTSVFTGFAPTATWKVRTTGATVSALSTFHVAEQTDYAFPA